MVETGFFVVTLISALQATPTCSQATAVEETNINKSFGNKDWKIVLTEKGLFISH